MSLKGDAPSLILPGDVLKVEDFTKAYFRIPMAEEFLPYQCFRGPDNELCTAVCLLFGNRLAPWVFTRVNKAIKEFFGVIGIPAFNYIDDWFWSVCRALMARYGPIIDMVMKVLGWSFAERKAQLGALVKVLGFMVDVDKRMFYVPRI